jgi:hypothetical protein
MFICGWDALMTPQNDILDSMRTRSCFVSYLRLSPPFQFSLSAAALDMYLYDCAPTCKLYCVRYVVHCRLQLCIEMTYIIILNGVWGTKLK